MVLVEEDYRKTQVNGKQGRKTMEAKNNRKREKSKGKRTGKRKPDSNSWDSKAGADPTSSDPGTAAPVKDSLLVA